MPTSLVSLGYNTDMTPDPSVGGAFAWAVWFLGDVAFKWIPGAVVSIAGTGVPALSGAPSPSIPAIDTAVTAPQIAQYLETASAPGVYDRIFHDWSVFVACSLLFSLLCAALIVYCCIRVFQIRQIEERKFDAAARSVAAEDVSKTQLRWRRILEQSRSDLEQNWRLAILEADIMLSELLDMLGYKGETMADKMRGIDRANFNTIDLAWEAHKIRNKIAHEGDAHLLSQREAHRVIALYERVFKEFRFIE
jgi:hypothetical protein